MAERYDENLFLGYVEGDLSPADKARFEKQLQADEQLARLVEQVMADRAALRAIPPQQASADLMDRVHQRLERSMLLGAKPKPGAAGGSGVSPDMPAGREDRTTGQPAAGVVARIGWLRWANLAGVAALLVIAANLTIRMVGQSGDPSTDGPAASGLDRVASVATVTDAEADEQFRRQADSPDAANGRRAAGATDGAPLGDDHAPAGKAGPEAEGRLAMGSVRNGESAEAEGVAMKKAPGVEASPPPAVRGHAAPGAPDVLAPSERGQTATAGGSEGSAPPPPAKAGVVAERLQEASPGKGGVQFSQEQDADAAPTAHHVAPLQRVEPGAGGQRATLTPVNLAVRPAPPDQYEYRNQTRLNFSAQTPEPQGVEDLSRLQSAQPPAPTDGAQDEAGAAAPGQVRFSAAENGLVVHQALGLAPSSAAHVHVAAADPVACRDQIVKWAHSNYFAYCAPTPRAETARLEQLAKLQAGAVAEGDSTTFGLWEHGGRGEDKQDAGVPPTDGSLVRKSDQPAPNKTEQPSGPSARANAGESLAVTRAKDAADAEQPSPAAAQPAEADRRALGERDGRDGTVTAQQQAAADDARGIAPDPAVAAFFEAQEVAQLALRELDASGAGRQLMVVTLPPAQVDELVAYLNSSPSRQTARLLESSADDRQGRAYELRQGRAGGEGQAQGQAPAPDAPAAANQAEPRERAARDRLADTPADRPAARGGQADTPAPPQQTEEQAPTEHARPRTRSDNGPAPSTPPGIPQDELLDQHRTPAAQPVAPSRPRPIVTDPAGRADFDNDTARHTDWAAPTALDDRLVLPYFVKLRQDPAAGPMFRTNWAVILEQQLPTAPTRVIPVAEDAVTLSIVIEQAPAAPAR